jgi:hypothetical protein
MYAQWRSLDDYETMRRDPGPVPFLQEALTIAKFEPGIYDVVESFAPPRALDLVDTFGIYRLGVFGASAEFTYCVSVGPKPEISTKTASAPVRAK